MWKFALYSSVKTSRQLQAAKPTKQHEGCDDKREYCVPQRTCDMHNMLLQTANDAGDTSAATSDVGCCKGLCLHRRASSKANLGSSDSFLAQFNLDSEANTDQSAGGYSQKGTSLSHRFTHCILHGVVHPGSQMQYVWLCIISAMVIYNYIVIIARGAFHQLQNDHPLLWIILDYSADAFYIVDMIANARTSYLSSDGILLEDRKLLLKHYLRSSRARLDVLSILPTDLIYLMSSSAYPLVRLNRLLKWTSVTEFFERTVRASNHATLFRVLNLIVYIMIIIHWNACIYFAISTAIGYNADPWVYGSAKYHNLTDEQQNSLSNKYIYSFYWSSLTLLTIGETEHPETDAEYIFTVTDFLLGVLVFATIVGNVGSMVTHINHDRGTFYQKIDDVKRYMKIRGVDCTLEKRILSWFDYVWANQLMLDESVLGDLPDQLRAKIALHVHMATLKQVGMFKNSEPGLLIELVLRLKLQVFSPGDYICRSGDIGREMFIVKSGVLQVVSDQGKQLATLHSGSIFGEISLLDIPTCKAGNRRIANVISIGYSDCFSLSKKDLWSLLNDYPQTKEEMVERGRQLLITNDCVHEEQLPASAEVFSATQEVYPDNTITTPLLCPDNTATTPPMYPDNITTTTTMYPDDTTKLMQDLLHSVQGLALSGNNETSSTEPTSIEGRVDRLLESAEMKLDTSTESIAGAR